jgi:hypothetical protein
VLIGFWLSWRDEFRKDPPTGRYRLKSLSVLIVSLSVLFVVATVTIAWVMGSFAGAPRQLNILIPTGLVLAIGSGAMSINLPRRTRAIGIVSSLTMICSWVFYAWLRRVYL